MKIEERLQELIQTLGMLLLDKSLVDSISNAANLISRSIKAGNKLIICGNGGSASDAQHMAAEFLCRFLKERPPMPAIALTTDTSVITAISNDFAFRDVFLRQVQGIGVQGDVLLGISTSGRSENVLQALTAAKTLGIKTIFLTGNRTTFSEHVDVLICVPSDFTPRIQEMHLVIEHIIAELVEEEMWPV